MALRRATRFLLTALPVVGVGVAVLTGCAASSIAERTYYGPPPGAKAPLGGWITGDVGGAVAVIETPDQLHIAVWENPMCHGIPEALKVIDRHTVRVTFHTDGKKGCRDDPNYPNGTGPLTSVLRLDPAKVDTTTDLHVVLEFTGSGPAGNEGGITARPREATGQAG
jgi:hypothetical protein